MKKIVYVTGSEADWFGFFLLWDDFNCRQGPRFGFGEGKLLQLSGFGRNFLDMTALRYFDRKLVDENINLRAPPKGQIHKCPSVLSSCMTSN